MHDKIINNEEDWDLVIKADTTLFNLKLSELPLPVSRNRPLLFSLPRIADHVAVAILARVP